MSAAVTVEFGGDTATAPITTVHVTASDLPSNAEASAQDVEDGVLAAPITYYLKGTNGVDSLFSQRFQVETDPTGDGVNGFTWNMVTIPSSGSWTFSVHKDSDDSQVAASDPITVG